jgi:hypothetical protein
MSDRRWTTIGLLAVGELALMACCVAVATRLSPASWSGVADAAAVSRSASHSLEAGTAPHVTIDDEGADVEFIVQPGAAVHVSEQVKARRDGADTSLATVTRRSDGVHIERTGNDMTFSWSGNDIQRTLTVTIPPATRLDVKNAGDINLSGLRADAKLAAANGRIVIRDHRGALDVNAENGRIELHDVSAPTIAAESDNGRIILDNVTAPHVKLRSGNGRIVGSNVVLGGGSVESSNGRVELGFARGSDVTITAHSSNGSVRAVEPLAASGRRGDDSDAPQTIRIGNGAGALAVSSDNGSIVISDGAYED